MPERAPEVVLVRHSETEWSRSGQHTGRTDLPLTETGRRDAEALRPRLAGRSFERVLTSPLARAAETCRLSGLGGRAEPRDELLEWDYGDYEGRTTPDIRDHAPGWDLWRDGCPGGESAADVARRVDRLIVELRALEGDAALFSHGHVLRVLAARWLEQPPENGARLALSTGAVGTLGYERETAVIRLWNDTAYLDAAGGAELAAVLDDHLAGEFELRDVDATMATMTDDPYLDHVPVMTGGVGRAEVRRFYERHFIPKWPDDVKVVPISRTIGRDRVVDEIVASFTHDVEMDFMLPGIAPTGRFVELPHAVVVKFEGGKVAHEHVYWDQASLLVQVGLLDPGALPVSGAEQAHKLLDRTLPTNTLMQRWSKRASD
jgi:broad specificity phosphatase PhoE